MGSLPHGRPREADWRGGFRCLRSSLPLPVPEPVPRSLVSGLIGAGRAGFHSRGLGLTPGRMDNAIFSRGGWRAPDWGARTSSFPSGVLGGKSLFTFALRSPPFPRSQLLGLLRDTSFSWPVWLGSSAAPELK